MPTRRRFLQSGAALAATVSPRRVLGNQANKNSRLRILQIGVGGIGQLDRRELASHPMVEFTGFCDVDSNWLAEYSKPYPDAFKVTDYREAFALHAEKFDAVVIDTPDFHHAPMLITALQNHKHIYGQKPLVQQLDELRLVRNALRKRPDCVTQMGNQRATNEGRLKAIQMLRKNQLGRPLHAHVWTGMMERGSHMPGPWSKLPEPQPVPSHYDWDLWHGPLTRKLPFSDEIAPSRWRGWWDTGTGMLGDWGCHLLDVLYYAYDLPSPTSVQTHTPRPPGEAHSGHNRSTITYPGGERFGRDKFVVHFCDDEIKPSFPALGLPDFQAGFNCTLIVCEEGSILLGDLGKIDVFRNGRRVNEPLPGSTPTSHWHDWVEACLGRKKAHRSPFEMALRITEPALLAVKATRFPGTDLRWDGMNHRFTNHEGANQQILQRDYREGFAPPEIS